MRARTARMSDASAVHRVIAHYAGEGLLLPRTEAEIREHIARFLVLVEKRNGDERVLGCVALEPYGPDLAELERLARLIEAAVRTVPGTTSAFAERIIGGYYLNIDPDRAQLARYGLMITDVQDMIASALGADAVTTTVEGRERYTVSLRYPRELRSDPQSIACPPMTQSGELAGSCNVYCRKGRYRISTRMPDAIRSLG